MFVASQISSQILQLHIGAVWLALTSCNVSCFTCKWMKSYVWFTVKVLFTKYCKRIATIIMFRLYYDRLLGPTTLEQFRQL